MCVGFGRMPLYENQVSVTEEGTIFTTSARIFAWNRASEYWFELTNWNPEKVAVITCRIYIRGDWQ